LRREFLVEAACVALWTKEEKEEEKRH